MLVKCQKSLGELAAQILLLDHHLSVSITLYVIGTNYNQQKDNPNIIFIQTVQARDIKHVL